MSDEVTAGYVFLGLGGDREYGATDCARCKMPFVAGQKLALVVKDRNEDGTFVRVDLVHDECPEADG